MYFNEKYYKIQMKKKGNYFNFVFKGGIIMKKIILLLMFLMSIMTFSALKDGIYYVEKNHDGNLQN